ncbi:MAG: 3-hydroxyacyl-CoA dehydrogenase NAD-binding domain-containing protein, partial [Terriglobia bacterium]
MNQCADDSMNQSLNESMTQSLNESIKLVGIAGAGTMGRGIAQTLLRSGYAVILADSSEAALAAARES